MKSASRDLTAPGATMVTIRSSNVMFEFVERKSDPTNSHR